MNAPYFGNKNKAFFKSEHLIPDFTLFWLLVKMALVILVCIGW